MAADLIDGFIDANIDSARNILIKANVAYDADTKLMHLEIAKGIINKTITLLNTKN